MPGIAQTTATTKGSTGGGAAYDFLSTLVSAEIAVTGTVTATISRMHVCSGTSANYTVTLPAASGNAGKFIGFRMAGIAALSKLVTLDGNGSETINGALTRILWADESAILLCDGSNWFKVGGNTIPMVAAMRLNAAQTGVANITLTKVNVDTSVTDNTGAMVDTSNKRINIIRPGNVQLIGEIVFCANDGSSSLGSAARALIEVHINGSKTAGAEMPSSGGTYPAPVSVAVRSVAISDYIEIKGYQSSAATAGFYGGAGQTNVNVIEVPSW